MSVVTVRYCDRCGAKDAQHTIVRPVGPRATADTADLCVSCIDEYTKMLLKWGGWTQWLPPRKISA